jgi:hypothetical protein
MLIEDLRVFLKSTVKRLTRVDFGSKHLQGGAKGLLRSA